MKQSIASLSIFFIVFSLSPTLYSSEQSPPSRPTAISILTQILEIFQKMNAGQTQQTEMFQKIYAEQHEHKMELVKMRHAITSLQESRSPVQVFSEGGKAAVSNTNNVSSANSLTSSNTAVIKAQFLNFVDACKQQAQTSTTSLANFISMNKLQVGVATFSISYIYLYWYLSKAKVIINDQKSWCNWKQTINLQHLVSTSYDDLIPELIRDIQKKYFILYKQTSNHLFNNFMDDVTQERKLLQKHLLILQYAKTFRCFKLLPFSHDVDIIQEKITRLNWLLELFATWQTQLILEERKES